MARAILEIVRDPERAQAVVAAGRERAMRYFDGAQNNRQVFEFYHTILSRRAN
jgi:hypothetical protein